MSHHTKSLGLNLIDHVGLMFFSELWFKGIGAITWCVQFKITTGNFYCFARAALFAIRFWTDFQMLKLYLRATSVSCLMRG
jgi:hypothetical protein